MPIHNSEIALKFYELADLLDIQQENPFRIRAYRNAARTIESLSQEITLLLKEEKDLTEFPGIGKDLAEKIKIIVETGDLPLLVETRKKIPPDLSEMMRIPNLGPKRIKRLYSELNIKTIDELKKMAEAGQICKLKGFGTVIEGKIKEALKKYTGKEGRIKLIDADKFARAFVSYLQKIPGVKDVVVAGSYRRKKDTIRDLDILATTKKDSPIIEKFTMHSEVAEIVSKGKTRSTILLHAKLQIDLRVVPQESYGAALVYFTGSKAHNISIRKIAMKKKLKINEYGVFKNNKRIAGKTEKEVYQSIGLAYIEPELREDRGEIEAAQKKALPKLVTLADIKGDLHCHTNETDGVHDLPKMIAAAQALNYQYIAITDHSQRLAMTRGLDEIRLRKQIEMIDELNANLKGIKILKSIECDILEDGTLDLPDSILKELDIRVCSLHYKFNLPMKVQTERIIKAMDNPYFNILAHPTGRLINRREPYELDLEKIMLAAKEKNCFLEVNAQPNRLDLNDVYCKMAKDIGVKLAISTDAHSVNNFQTMQYGIAQARRGWLEKEDIINTRTWPELKKLLKK